jgi:hypothetical protein
MYLFFYLDSLFLWFKFVKLVYFYFYFISYFYIKYS